MPEDPEAWWSEGVLYQIYPRSYADSNGDGVGDLPGITQRLDHLSWLGVKGIWLDPITVSPNADWGYDVSDFCDVDPALGTLEDLDALVSEAAKRDLRVILDLVPNHTSIEHPWFIEARASRSNPKRDWYVWADPSEDGGPPNNWASSFGGPAWTLDETTGQYFLHNFLSEQPDLNWWNPEVRDEFDRILAFWFDRGVAGFRIDVVHMVIKDEQLRDNPPVEDGDHWFIKMRGQRQFYNSCRPEVHDVIKRWRSIADSYTPKRVLIGETHVFDTEMLASFYGDDDELNLGFNFLMIHAPLSAEALGKIIEDTDAAIPSGSAPVWTGGNHDNYRFPSRWAEGDADRARSALVMLLTLRGCVFLYYGDEIGMPDTEVPLEQILDPVGIRMYPVFGRDPERTPMQWDANPGFGFTEPGVEPWLPFGDAASFNVADQVEDPDSFLTLTRDLIALRDAEPDLRSGTFNRVSAPEGILAYTRGDGFLIAASLDQGAGGVISGVNGKVAASARRARDGEQIDGDLTLEPGDALVIRLSRRHR